MGGHSRVRLKIASMYQPAFPHPPIPETPPRPKGASL